MRQFYKAAMLAAGSLLIGAAQAQEPEEEVVVTATRVASAVRGLPADVDVIDPDAARARGAVTLDAALADTPGMQAPRAGPFGQQASLFSGGFESNHTLVLFDGVRLDDPSTPEGIFDAGQDLLGDAQRIEVVQGPMSALYGSGALGGVVNVLPRHGGEGAFNPRLEAAAGSFETAMVTAGADGALGPLRYALTADAFASEGYDILPERIATHTGEKDGAEMATLTGVFDLALSQQLTLDLLVRRREARADYDPGLFGDIAESDDAEIAKNDTTLWRLGASWSPDAAFGVRVAGGALETDRITTEAGVVGDVYRGARRFADLGATWRVQDWTLSFGAQGEDEDIDAVSFGSPVVGDQTHWGVYGAAQGELAGFDVTAAVRRDDFEGFGAQTTWRTGASHKIGERARIYGAYGTSYRAPSLYERFVPFFGAAGLQPESATSWEIGGDVTVPLLQRQDWLELSALYRSSEIDDLIGFAGFSYANVDQAEIRFAEARVTLRPTSWLTARFSYANTDARDAAADEPLQRRPRHAWFAALQAERGPFAADLSWRQTGARMDTVYDDLGLFAGVGRVASYEIVRASASWRVNEDVQLYLAGDNVLDEIYEPVNGFAGAPASVLIGVRLRPSFNGSE